MSVLSPPEPIVVTNSQIYKSHSSLSLVNLFRASLYRVLLDPIDLVCFRIRYKAVAHPGKIIMVDPTQIDFYRDRPRRGTKRSPERSLEHRFRVMGGDWDGTLYRVTDHLRYRGLVERFVHGKDWRDTVIFQMEVMNGKTTPALEIRVATFIEKCRRRDSLFESIKKNGVLPSSEISRDSRRHFDQGSERNVSINIGRDGRLIFTRKGWHRLCIAKILDLRSMPVEVDLRHSEWQEIREEVRRSRHLGELSERARAHLTHPDLEDLMPRDWLNEAGINKESVGSAEAAERYKAIQ